MKQILSEAIMLSLQVQPRAQYPFLQEEKIKWGVLYKVAPLT